LLYLNNIANKWILICWIDKVSHNLDDRIVLVMKLSIKGKEEKTMYVRLYYYFICVN